MKTTVLGTIGNDKHMIPSRRMITLNGERVSILTFKMFEIGVNGKESIQVNMHDNPYNRKRFDKLSASRRVLVQGTYTTNPKATTNTNGQIQLDSSGKKPLIWTNPTIWANEIAFADVKPETIFANSLTKLASDTQIISQLMDKIIGEEITSPDDTVEFLKNCFNEFAQVLFRQGRDEDSFKDEDTSNSDPMTDGAIKE